MTIVQDIYSNLPALAPYIMTAIVVGVFVNLLLIWFTKARLRKVVNNVSDLNSMMSQALGMGDYYVTVYDVDKDLMKNLYGSLLPDEGMSLNQFVERIHPNEQAGFLRETDKMIAGESRKWELTKRWNAAPEGLQPSWQVLHGHAIAEIRHGRTRFIINSVKDLTLEMKEEEREREVGSKYRRIFDTNLVAMSFYTHDGWLVDLNHNMRKLCGITTENEQFFRQTNLKDFPILSGDFNPDSREPFHVCQHMHYPNLGIDKYIEFKIRPIFDDNNRLVYYNFGARDITSEREMYLTQQRHNQELQELNKTISEYEKELHYLLENSQMYAFQANLTTQTITFSRSLRIQEYSITFQQYLDSMFPEHQALAADIFGNKEKLEKPVNMVHHFRYTPIANEESWYAISAQPTFDQKGQLTGHFGVVRDVTQLMQAQEKLRQETLRAEDSGRMKSAFLANMTHEIRTPLNAIVGFSDLLQVIDEADERREFIRIIRNNCDMLLRLINDILEASTPGQALSIEPQDVDFAIVFDDICQTLSQRVQEPGVLFIKDNPYRRLVTYLDKGRIQQIYTNFVTNAVKYTHDGHIRVGYRLEQRQQPDGRTQEGLYFYCEDTGAGISKEKQASVFERFVKLNDFVQGTGLGLSICKSIAEHCEGDIGVYSEGEGKGCTFWVWIPCTIKEQESIGDTK